MAETAVTPLQVATFYRFTTLEDPAALRMTLLERGARAQLKGTVLLATEGLNATICGTSEGVADFITSLQEDARFVDLPVKYSQVPGDAPAFLRFKVKLKAEIVTLGVPGVDVAAHSAQRVAPAAFNELLADPRVAVLDVRNHYETRVGSFEGAEDPNTESFREFPSYIEARFGEDREQPIAMFCTGGIRCEKASAYLREQGFSQVYQLDGGVLRYLEQVPPEHSRWRGDCFVFDQRVTVDHALSPGEYRQCFACRRPVSPQATASPKYREGVSCPACFDEKSEQERAGYMERQNQMALARDRGVAHIGPEAQQGSAGGDAESASLQELGHRVPDRP
ncbi:MAG: rhodanese-related sulfurtransferase [Pseudomonadota bacterium]